MNKLNITGNTFPLTVENLQVLQSQTELIQSAFLASISLQVSDDSIFLYLIKDANDNKICAYYKGELYSIVIRSTSATRYVLVEKKVSVSTDTETFADVRLERYLVVGSKEAGETIIKSFDSTAIRLVSLRADLIEKITTAQTTADTASTTATAAQNTAASAMDKAIEAADAAATAQSTADTASTTANTAKTTAEMALENSDAALNAADSAEENANTASSTANSAKITADTAQTTADTAQSTADTAKSTADTAKLTADTAKSTADAAKTTANAAQTNATEALNAVKSLQDTIETYTRTYLVRGVKNKDNISDPLNFIMGQMHYWTDEENYELYLNFKAKNNTQGGYIKKIIVQENSLVGGSSKTILSNLFSSEVAYNAEMSVNHVYCHDNLNGTILDFSLYIKTTQEKELHTLILDIVNYAEKHGFIEIVSIEI